MTAFEVERIAVLDTETTGLKPSNISAEYREYAGRVLQYGMVILAADDLRVLEKRMTYVCVPSADWVHASPKALEVNGITTDVIGRYGRLPNEALTWMFGDSTKQNLDWWSRTILACWGVDFDLGFVESEYDLCGRKSPIPYRTLDVRSVCNVVVPKTSLNGDWEYEGLLPWVGRNVPPGVFSWARDIEDAITGLRSLGIGERGHDALVDALFTVLALRSVRSGRTL